MRTEIAQRWQESWDRQQERYIVDRDRRFGVVADVVGWSAGRAGTTSPLVVDLGCGPGSLTRRVAADVSGARVVGVDSDPLLLALAEAAPRSGTGPSAGDGPAAGSGPADGGGPSAGSGPTYVRADLTDPAWPRRAGVDGTWDAAVSATALHWLAPDDLAELHRVVAAHLRPGGVFVDSDHRRPAGAAGAELAAYLSDVARDGRYAGVDEWGAWWDAVRADPELGALVDERSEPAVTHHSTHGLSIEEQTRMLLAAGFAEVTTAWQHGDDHVLVAVR